MSAIRTDLDERLIAKLRERGMRVTPQRVMIHRVLCAEPRHMTAEQILDAVERGLPGTSLPTVYATLELFEELELVRRLATGGGAVLYESRAEPHAHTICRSCGTTTDLIGTTAPAQALTRASATGFVPDHAELVIWGLCESCAAQSRAA